MLNDRAPSDASATFELKPEPIKETKASVSTKKRIADKQQYQSLRVNYSKPKRNSSPPSPPEYQREMAFMLKPGHKHPLPDFSSPPRPLLNEGPRLLEYKQRLLDSLKKKAQARGDELEEEDRVAINKYRKSKGLEPRYNVAYNFTDEGHIQPSSENLRAEAINYTSSGKKRRWNPEKERYMDFCVSFGITKPEDSDLNMSPEGKMRR